MSDARKWFQDSDEDQSDQEQQIKDAEIFAKEQTMDLYQQNLKKYIDYLKDFSYEAEQKQENLFEDGISNVSHPLIQITHINYQKNIGIFDLIELGPSDTAYIRSCVAFTFLDNEVNKVIELLELDLYDSLLMYGQQAQKKDPNDVQLAQIMTAKTLVTYKKIYDLIKKLMSYIENIVQQLHCIINKKQSNYKTLFKMVNLDFVIQILGRALRAIYIVDCIVENNQKIIQHWELYKKLIKIAKNQPEKFGVTLPNLKKLDKTLNRYENTILSKKCMQTVMGIKYDETYEKTKAEVGNIRSNKELRQYFQSYFERQLEQINKNLGSKYQNNQQLKLLDLMCVYALYRRLFPSQQSKDFYKNLWQMQKKLPIIQAHSFVCIYIYVFLSTVCPLNKKSKSLDPKDPNEFIVSYISKLNENIKPVFIQNYTKFTVWLSRMQSIATSNYSLRDLKQDQKTTKIISERISNRILMLCEGIGLILKMNRLLYLTFILHMNEERAIPYDLLQHIILAMQSLKATSQTLKKKADAFDTTILSKTIARDFYAFIKDVYNKLLAEQKNKKKPQNLDKLAALKLIMELLQTPVSQLKIAMIKYSLAFVGQIIIGKQHMEHFKLLIKKLEIVCYQSHLIQKYENSSYLYSCKQILAKIFQWKQNNPNSSKRLQLLFSNFQDTAFLILKCPHLTNQQQLFLEYKQYILHVFEQHYMRPLKVKVEDFLRVTTHSMLIQKIEGLNPYTRQMTDLTKLVQSQKIRIFDSLVDLKLQISRSFNETFYNMNILNMHDMQTYQLMRVLGNHLFGLSLHEVYLPIQTISQGKFDILQIIRGIPQFIDKYKYNLLSQKFLEVTGQGKIISSISIQQLSDSIRTHGLGILATTVNAFYKFLVTKVQAFNKFLYDDYIQSPLAKQRRWFKQYTNRQDYEGYYPYQKAQTLYKQIKKIGRFEDQTNFLDKFRETITAVGNSLGFVRLLRSASLNSSSKTVEFLPRRIEQINETFEQIASKTSLTQNSRGSCKQLDDILKSMDEKFSSKIDYLTLMIKLFSKIVTKQNKHLRLFYLIIPALTINYIEYVCRGKQKINKKLSTGAFIYDDGFILGLSYFINLLKQTQEYKTMHWDDSTTINFQKSKNYSKDITAANHSTKYIQDLNMQKQLLIKKLEMINEEFTFFHYNMVSSNVLFKKTTEAPKQSMPASPPTQVQQNKSQS